MSPCIGLPSLPLLFDSELVRLKKKEEKMQFLALTSSVCRRQIVGVKVGLLDVQSLVEHDDEG